MHAVGCDAEQYVARRDARAVDDARFLHDAYGKAGEVIFARRIHSRHLRSLAADQRTACALAPGRDALHDLGCGRDIEPAARVIIEEEERLGAEREDVVHAHRDEIDADRVVAVELEGELQLRSDTVGAGYEHGLAITLRHLEQRTEAADAREDTRTKRAFRERLDAFDELVARVDVDSRVAISESSRCAHAVTVRG